MEYGETVSTSPPHQSEHVLMEYGCTVSNDTPKPATTTVRMEYGLMESIEEPSITISHVQTPAPHPMSTLGPESHIRNLAQPHLNLRRLRIKTGCRRPPYQVRQKKQKECLLCGDRTHTERGCYFRNQPKVGEKTELMMKAKELPRMTLEERVSLLYRPAQRTEPSKKTCRSAASGYPGRDEDQEESNSWDDRDADLWHNDDLEG